MINNLDKLNQILIDQIELSQMIDEYQWSQDESRCITSSSGIFPIDCIHTCCDRND